MMNGNGHAQVIHQPAAGSRDPAQSREARKAREIVAKLIEQGLESGPVAKCAVEVYSHHGKSRIGEWPIQGSGLSPDDVAQLVVDRAIDDAQVALGEVRFIAAIFREEGALAFARQFFTLLGSRGNVDEALYDPGDDEPSARGLTAASMRHAEWGVRTSLIAMREALIDARQEVVHLREELDKANNKRVEIVSLYEELASRKHERDIQMRKQMIAERHWDALGDQLAKVANLGISHLTTQGMSTMAPLIKLGQLLGNLDKDQGHALAMVFAQDPAQMQLFMSLVRDLEGMKPPTPEQRAAVGVPPASKPTAGDEEK